MRKCAASLHFPAVEGISIKNFGYTNQHKEEQNDATIYSWSAIYNGLDPGTGRYDRRKQI